MRYGLTLLLLATLTARLATQQLSVPAPVRRGLELWRADSVEAAVHVWAAAWTGPADAGKAERVQQAMGQFAAMGGRANGYDVLGIDSVGAHLRRVYAVLRYERVPVFAQFVVYNPGDSAPAWTVLSVRTHTEAQQALPPSVWPH